MSFNENSRVKIPAILHLMKLGYWYIPINQQHRRDDTNIFEDIFVESLLRINPGADREEILRLLDEISLESDYEDLGEKFYHRLTTRSGIKLIDFKNFDNNSFHVTAELTAKNGEKNTIRTGYFSSVINGRNNSAIGSCFTTVVNGDNVDAQGCFNILGTGTNNNTNNTCFNVLTNGDDNRIAGVDAPNTLYNVLHNGTKNRITGTAADVQTCYDYIGTGNRVMITDSNFGFIDNGDQNTITEGCTNAIVNGLQNLTEPNVMYSIIGNGQLNCIMDGGLHSGVFSGLSNCATGGQNVIAGGYYNAIQTGAGQSGIFAGYGNILTSMHGVISGGQQNTLTGACAVIGGGLLNEVNGDFSSVLGGQGNIVNSLHSVVLGGQDNGVTGNCSSIVGGLENEVEGIFSAVVGGRFNRELIGAAAATANFIGGGCNHLIQRANESGIASGYENSVTGSCSFIGGGKKNVVNGAFSAVLGGEGNLVAAAYDHVGIFGQNITNVLTNHFHVNNLVAQNIPIGNTITCGPPGGAIPGQLYFLPVAPGGFCQVWIA